MPRRVLAGNRRRQRPVQRLAALRREIAVEGPAGDERLACRQELLLEVGDVVRVFHGVSPPADGIIVLGDSTFDESSLTGESRPIIKNTGDQVFAGTINTGKPINVRVTEVSGASMLDQIVNVVREGQTKRAPVERVADILTGYFVPVITLIATSTFVIWFGLGQGGALPESWRDINTGGWAFWALRRGRTLVESQIPFE